MGRTLIAPLARFAAALFLATSPFMATPAAAQDALPSPEELIEGHIEALGGREAVESATSRKFEGTMEIARSDRTIKALVTLITAKPDKLRQEIFAPGRFDETLIFDGEGGWTVLDGNPSPLAGGRLNSTRETADFNAYYGVGYEDRYVELETVRYADLRGETLAMVRGKRHSGQQDFLFFDPNTSLLRCFRVVQVDDDSDIPPAEYWIEEYEDTDTHKVPVLLRIFGPNYTSTIRYTSFEINPDVSDAFDDPSAG